MSSLIVRINRVTDSAPWPELEKMPRKEIVLSGCTILEHGTESGKVSLIFHGIENGTVVMFQITGAMLETVAGALKGAELRWAEDRQRPS